MSGYNSDILKTLDHILDTLERIEERLVAVTEPIVVRELAQHGTGTVEWDPQMRAWRGVKDA